MRGVGGWGGTNLSVQSMLSKSAIKQFEIGTLLIGCQYFNIILLNVSYILNTFEGTWF